MSQPESVTIRQTLQELLRERDDPPTRSELVLNANLRLDASAPMIAGEVDELERRGLVYCVGEDDPEVKIP
jgi:hypothetical protein